MNSFHGLPFLRHGQSGSCCISGSKTLLIALPVIWKHACARQQRKKFSSHLRHRPDSDDCVVENRNRILFITANRGKKMDCQTLRVCKQPQRTQAGRRARCVKRANEVARINLVGKQPSVLVLPTSSPRFLRAKMSAFTVCYTDR